ncbi:MAG: acyl-ACP--UDP-N-acetylglucosamine O-acyltransferase [bacterium]
MSQIDPRAIIDPGAVIGENVSIGPWTIVGPDVEIGDNCSIASHVVIKGPTRIGRGNKVLQFSTLGEDTPDLKYKGEPTRLLIGDNNIFREGVTVHRGTVQDRGETVIGSDNLLMAYVHVGHDSVVGDHTILVNNASLAGHVNVGDWAILSGYTLVHQFVSVGAHSFCGAGTFLTQDLPAFVTAAGNPAKARTINSEGMKRRGFRSDQISAVSTAYKNVYRKGLRLEEAIAAIENDGATDPAVSTFLASLKGATRGIVR